jgi:hypothetical protein
MCRFFCWGVALSLAWASLGEAAAAPFTGKGSAPLAEGSDRAAARKTALERARRAAIEAALAELSGPLTPAARAQALTTAAAWTSSYRVLSQLDDGATLTVEIAAEIDLGRLEKAVTPAAAPQGARALPRLAAVSSEGCAGELAGELGRLLAARGVIAADDAAAAGSIEASLRCEALGQVSPARAFGAAATVTLRMAGSPPLRGEARAFSGDPAAAEREAVARVSAGLADSLQAEEEGIVVRVAAPWPAARLRRLERAIAASVVGVRAVSVAGIAADGAVLLRVEGSLAAAALASKLEGLATPGARLERVSVRGERLIEVALGPASTSPSAPPTPAEPR